MELKSSTYRSRLFVVAALIQLFVFLAPSAQAAGSRDVLWDILTSCLDPGVAEYCTNCRSPRVGTPCAAVLPCQETTEVWAETAEYVAIRDRKMCGCPEGFVHGLVLPRQAVTGVEDPRRPDGIWSFAWTMAQQRIGDDSAAALAVNPPGRRAQDQLHVHVLRLRPDARERFAKAHTSQVRKLDEVWQAAARTAAAAGLSDYGILVASQPQGGFVVVVDKASPEKSYGIERCR